MSDAPQGRRRRTPVDSFEPTGIAPLPTFGPQPTKQAPAAAEPAQDAGEAATPPAPASRATAPKPPATRRARASRTTKSARPGLAVRCYPDVEQLWETAHDAGISYRQILFDALEATADDLPTLIAEQRAAQQQRANAPRETGRLFAPKAAPHALDTLGETRVLHIDAQYHQVIRDLQASVGAQTPNEMYNAALRAHLGGSTS